MQRNGRYGNPSKRQTHSEQRGYHARTYLITWDIHAMHNNEICIQSRWTVVHSMTEVMNAYGWIYEQQENARPADIPDNQILPMPRVFPVDGYIRELPESGYDLIAPRTGIECIDPGNDGYAQSA